MITRKKTYPNKNNTAFKVDIKNRFQCLWNNKANIKNMNIKLVTLINEAAKNRKNKWK